MGQALAATARDLGCSERTLRRYLNGGLLRGRQLDRYRFELPDREERYARSHWGLLHGLRTALRTERDVRLAILFGSISTGEDTESSDVDLMVVSRRDDVLASLTMRRRLSDALGRRVHLVDLQDARRSANLLADILSEGRVVIDRDNLWPGLMKERAHILQAAAHEDDETLTRAYAVADSAKRRIEG